MNRITNLRENFLTDKLLLIRKSKIIYILLNHNIQNSIDDLERLQSLKANTKLKIRKNIQKGYLERMGKNQKDELELANEDSWAKTAECIAKTMQEEALKLMRYLPTKTEAKYETATIIIYSQYHINLE